MKALSAREIVIKVLEKGKNDILYVCLRHMSETHKKFFWIIDDINNDPTKISFYDCGLYTNTKIM